jgi:hypothetical protein
MGTKFRSENMKVRDHLGSYRCSWEDNIKMDLKRNKWRGYGLDSCDSGLGSVAAHVYTVMNLGVSINGGVFLDQLSDY